MTFSRILTAIALCGAIAAGAAATIASPARAFTGEATCRGGEDHLD